MKRNADFRNALGQPDDIFRQSVIDTLTELNQQAERETRPARRFPLRAACAFAAALVLAAGLTAAVRKNMLENLTASREDPVNPTPEVISAPEEQPAAVLKMKQATVSVRDIVTDGVSHLMTVEVLPAQANSLALHCGIDPYRDSPAKIGKTADRQGQTILEWSRAHGYEDLLQVSFYPRWSYATPVGVPMEIRENGASVFTVRCGNNPDPGFFPFPGDTDYDMTCSIVPWDPERENDYNEDGSIRAITVISEREESAELRYAVPGTEETPQYFARYKVDPGSATSKDQATLTVSFFRTSLGTYFETSATEKTFVFHRREFALFRDEDLSESFGCPDAPGFYGAGTEISAYHITRTAWQFPEELPEELWITAGLTGISDKPRKPLNFRLVKDKEFELIRCSVAAKADGGYLTVFTVDKGSAEGLEENLAVLYGGALIGVVADVRDHEATVRSIIDPESCIAGIIRTAQDSQGVVKGAAGENLPPDSTLLCRIEYLPEGAVPVPGDTVVTAGTMALPGNIPVGTVTGTGKDPETGLLYATVEPLADFLHLETVDVLRFTPETLPADPE